MLQGISGSLDVLNKRVATGSTEGMQRAIDSGRRSSDRAAALVQRLLAFARRQPLKTSAVPLNQLVTSMRDLLRQSLGDTIVLALDLDPTTPRASCDPNQLENAILNLVINARDAMPQGGTVTVRTSTVDALVDTTSGAPLDMGEASAARSRDGGYSIVEVEDTGTGMPAEVRKRAFDPFFTTKPMGKGTGLGLSMIYGFAKQSGGACDIQSEPGRGTRVRLILPAAPSSDGEREVVPAAASRPSPRRGRLLVVEDDDVVRGLVVEALQDLGFEVHQAADGAVAMRMLDGPLDLLVTDIGLPGASGVEVAESARRNHPQMPVLFMTGYNRDGAGTAPVLGAGMSLISKPFDMAVLAARVSEMVSQ
ncbi:ATP-binding protein [Roseateles chitinivorans]|uniref:ATP-binding protein n=1 Tax=Roseateles chitinivorans TaxID=2917965 RepID=UPI003D6651B6